MACGLHDTASGPGGDAAGERAGLPLRVDSNGRGPGASGGARASGRGGRKCAHWGKAWEAHTVPPSLARASTIRWPTGFMYPGLSEGRGWGQDWGG